MVTSGEHTGTGNFNVNYLATKDHWACRPPKETHYWPVDDALDAILSGTNFANRSYEDDDE